jgi:taurine dioxygenase
MLAYRSPTFHPGPRPHLRSKREALEALAFEHVEIRPLSPTIGAEIHGIDLSKPIDDRVFGEIERALQGYKVIFFRNQDVHVEDHLAFARRFGELETHPFIPHKEGYPEVIRFEKDEALVGVENIWHSDVSWREVPSLGSLLRAVEVPDVGGDTLFSDMVAAYHGLDPALRERIDGLVAVHDFTHSFGAAMKPEELAESRKKYPSVEHPVVRTHPVTGERAIYVNSVFTSHIVGLAQSESDDLLEILYRQAAVPEYQCRFRWEKNSIAFWDNRAVQHYASSDYDPQRRLMDRVTVIGDRPV